MAMMISKFHKLVASRKVWTVFAVLISVAFVIAYTGGKSGRQKQRLQKQAEVAGKLFGEKITREEFGQAFQNTYLMLMLANRQPIRINDQVQQLITEQAWVRLAVLKKAEQMGLTTTPEQVAEAIRQQAIFRNPKTGAFERQAYDLFFNQILPKQLGIRMTPKQFDNLIRENLLIEKASNTAIQCALVTDEELGRAFHIYADKLTVQYAAIARSLAPAPEVTEADAREYYGKYPNQFTYPDKVKVRYVEFSVADYTNEVVVTDGMITNLYQGNKEMFVKPGTEDNSPPEYQTLAEVKDQIATLAVSGLARQKAQDAAGILVSKLASQNADAATAFDKAAQEAGKTIQSTPPFALNDAVRNIDPTAPFARAAFGLQQDDYHYFSDPVPGKDSVYVMVLQAKMPSFLPEFEVVAEEARKAAQSTATEKTYFEKAESLHRQIEDAIRTGTPFEAAAKELGLEVVTTGPFSLQEPPEEEIDQTMLRSTYLFDAGSLVDLMPNGEEYLMVYVAERQPANLAGADPATVAQLKSNVRQDKAKRLASAWEVAVMQEAALEDLSQKKSNDNS